MNDSNAPAVFSEYIGAIEPYPLTDDELTNYEVYDNVIMMLAKIANSNKSWDEPLKRRVAYEYVRIVVLGKTGGFFPDLGDVYYRAGIAGPELYANFPIPWLSVNEITLIGDTIKFYHNEAQNPSL